MKAISRRLRRLEDQFGPADGKPREHFRLVLRPAGLNKPDLANSTCRRTLCPNGTVSESIVLAAGHGGREITDDELEEWVESFPIETEGGPIRVRRLPPP